MTRAMSTTGAVALLAVMLGTACSAAEEEPRPTGSGVNGGSNSGGQNPGGAGGVLGNGGSGNSGDGGTLGVGGVGGVGGNSGVGGDAGTGNAGTGNAGTGGDAGTGNAGTGNAGTGNAGTGNAGTGGDGGPGGGTGKCCPSGNCICREPVPTMLTGARGPFTTMSYNLTGVGCVHYPTSAEPPFSAVAISDGYLGSGGCGAAAQTSGWGPLLASYGIVTMIINTTGSDQPATRGTKLLGGIAGFKSENMKSGSPLFGKLAGRYGTSGFSMGGGGTTRATVTDKTLLSSVAIMPWSPLGTGVVTPTLIICGNSDGIAPCASHGTPVYSQIPAMTPKMRVEVTSGHSGQPSAGRDMSGAWGLAFHKVFLDGDDRWRAVLKSGMSVATNIQ